MIVGFDFDGTLNSPTGKRFFKTMANSLNKCDLVVVTNRVDIDDEITDVIKEIGLGEVLVYAIGESGYRNKAAFIAEEELVFDTFFENDENEVKSLNQIGISCFKVEEA